MSDIVISFQKIGSGSYEMPTLKIAKFLAEEFSCVIVDSLETAAAAMSLSSIKRVFVVSGMWQFCKFRDVACELVIRAMSLGAKLYFCCNDYKTPMPGELKRVAGDSFARVCNGDYGPGSIMVNWNALTFYRGVGDLCSAPKNNNMIYYGAYRDGRKSSFDAFFSGRKIKTFISTSERNFPEFKSHGPVEYEPLKDICALSKKYGFTVYVSDKVNHSKMFVFPANRFYECLSYGIFQFIDEKTMLSFKDFDKKAIQPFVVASDSDVFSKIQSMDLLRSAQKRLLYDAKDYRAHLVKRLKDVIV